MKIKIYPLKTECIFLELVLAVVICVGNLFGLTKLISIAFLFTFFILLFLLITQSKGRRLDRQYAVLAALSILNVIFNALLSPIAHLSFDYLKKLIMFISAMTFFVIIKDIEIEEIDKKISFRMGFIISIIFPFAFFVLNIKTMLGRYLTMGFSNPNFTALWILHGFLFSIIAFFRTKRFLGRVLIVIFGISLLFIVSLTLNRSIWIALFGFVLLLFYGVLRKKKALDPIIITIIVILPIIIVLLYQSLLSNNFIQKSFSFMISEGKGLTSRSRVWGFAIDKLKTGWLLGDYSGISNGTGMSQMHNTHLDVLCSYGIIPFTLFLLLLRNVCLSINEEITSFEQYVALCAFLSILLFGIFEAALFSGCTGLNYLTGAFLILARQDK